MIKAAKIAISLPKKQLDKIERIRKKMGMERSALINLAVEHWLKNLEEEELMRQYEEGYRRIPESTDDFEAWDKLAAEAFKAEGLE